MAEGRGAWAVVGMEKGDEWDPQGSVLRLVLFLVFIDDLEQGLMSYVLKFADDTKIFMRVDSNEEIKVLQRDLDRLVDWSEMWQMRFNVDKCKVMHFGRGNWWELRDDRRDLRGCE